MIVATIRFLWYVAEAGIVTRVAIDHRLGFWIGFLIWDVIMTLTTIAYSLLDLRVLLLAKKSA